jgi:hypothetical protein
MRIRNGVTALVVESSPNDEAGIEAATPKAAAEATMNSRRVVAMRWGV